MADKCIQNERRPVRWKRDNLEAWRAALSPGRRENDRRNLEEIFNLAARIPILKDALDWAREHDIEFIVDNTTTAGAYYYAGSGVIGVGARFFSNPGTMVSFLVHEIRHAWQDYYHMIPTAGKNFAGYFMREALIEADASAHQDVALRQYNLATLILRVKNMMDEGRPERRPGEHKARLAGYERELAASTRDAGRYWKGFAGWFKSWKAAWYGDGAINRFGHALEVPGAAPRDGKYEYNPYENQRQPVEEGIDVSCMDDLRRLGKTFNNLNYFNADRERSLTLEFTSPSAAQRFYTGERSGMLVEEVRRRWLSLTLKERREVMICPD
jgi:hypothetical protein